MVSAPAQMDGDHDQQICATDGDKCTTTPIELFRVTLSVWVWSLGPTVARCGGGGGGGGGRQSAVRIADRNALHVYRNVSFRPSASKLTYSAPLSPGMPTGLAAMLRT